MILSANGAQRRARSAGLLSSASRPSSKQRANAGQRAGKLIHGILDNYAAHKHPKVRAWLTRHPRWTFHFTPTSCWAQCGGDLLCLLRSPAGDCSAASFDLQAAINPILGEHNRKPKPFVWTADPNRIIEKINREHQLLASDH
jgi:hypothetical protein